MLRRSRSHLLWRSLLSRCHAGSGGSANCLPDRVSGDRRARANGEQDAVEPAGALRAGSGGASEVGLSSQLSRAPSPRPQRSDVAALTISDTSSVMLSDPPANAQRVAAAATQWSR